jgi:hypothetical protein
MSTHILPKNIDLKRVPVADFLNFHQLLSMKPEVAPLIGENGEFFGTSRISTLVGLKSRVSYGVYFEGAFSVEGFFAFVAFEFFNWRFNRNISCIGGIVSGLNRVIEIVHDGRLLN